MRGFARFISFARTARRIERPQQLDGGSSRIFHAMAHTYWEVNAATRPEFTGSAVGVHDPAAFQNEDGFFIRVVVNRSFARRDPSRELSDLLTAEVRID